MLKVCGLSVALSFALSAAASAEPGLVVGSVRDESGIPLRGAVVTLLDATGREVGRDVVDERGTFAARASGDAVEVRIRCRHCAKVRERLAGRTEVTLIVRHDAALERVTPGTSDLAALPYGRVADALALTPFTLPSADGTSISDRGLGGGRGLIVDDGAPAGDFSTPIGALADFPNRYARSLALLPPATAYRYAGDGGGGRFLVDQLAGDGEGGTITGDAGGSAALAIEPTLGFVHPSLGISSDDGNLARRADLDAAAPLGSGFIRAGLGADSLETPPDAQGARNVQLFRLAYATQSSRFRTVAALSATDAATLSDVPGGSAYRSSYLDFGVRVERPAPVTVAFGISADRQTAYETAFPSSSYDLTGRPVDEDAYVEAFGGDSRASFDAGLAVNAATLTESLTYSGSSGHFAVVLPSLAGRVALGSDVYVHAAFSESAQIPSLDEANAAATYSAAAPLVERGALLESGAGYDAGGRVTAEAIAYRELRRGTASSDLDGGGFSVAWQAAPRLTVRAWSLRDVPAPADVPGLLASGYAGTSLTGKQLAWLTYTGGPDGVRFDAIAHRDVTPSAAAFYLDGSVLLPLVNHVAVAAGTVQHGFRTYYIGLRAR